MDVKKEQRQKRIACRLTSDAVASLRLVWATTDVVTYFLLNKLTTFLVIALCKVKWPF